MVGLAFQATLAAVPGAHGAGLFKANAYLSSGGAVSYSLSFEGACAECVRVVGVGSGDRLRTGGGGGCSGSSGFGVGHTDNDGGDG